MPDDTQRKTKSTAPAASSPPALSDADLYETLDLLATVVASVSDRVDAQTEALDRLTKTTAETRQAAFAAKSQTDPKYVADHLGGAVDEKLADALSILLELHAGFGEDRDEAQKQLDELTTLKADLLDSIRAEKAKAQRWRSRAPFIALGGLVLVLALSIALPRFMAANRTGCAVFGGQWLSANTSGRLACVFYAK